MWRMSQAQPTGVGTPGTAGIAGTAGTVRMLMPGDWQALRAARLAALAEAPYAFGSTLERELILDEAHWRGRIAGSAFFAAWRDGQVIGMACGLSGEAEGADAAEQGARSWHLVSMWAAPDARGTGVADQLVAAVCEQASGSGADRVTLWVTDVNARARAFYQRLGFVPTGKRQPVRPDDPGHWEQELARELG